MPKVNSIKSILVIGSGPIIIGQACEFDYSGSQALRSLREDGIKTILINSNPATIMTDPEMADHVYLKPLNTKSIIEILKNEKIEVLSSIHFNPELTGRKGIHTKIKPSRTDIQSINRGIKYLAKTNSYDHIQALVVRDLSLIHI